MKQGDYYDTEPFIEVHTRKKERKKEKPQEKKKKKKRKVE
jgi:hypothetical protein